MNSYGYIVMIGSVILTLLGMRRDFRTGLGTAVSLLVLLPREMQLPLGDAVPAVTVHRMLLVVMFAAWISRRAERLGSAPVPFLKVMWLIAICDIISAIGSPAPNLSLKELLSFVIETIGLYVILVSSLTTREDAYSTLRAVWRGVAIVAVFGFLERYARFGVLVVLGLNAGIGKDIVATYPHRILFGYAMAAGWPLVLALLPYSTSRSERSILVISSLLLVAACYFSTSRGPWLGFGIGCGLMLLLGGASVRRRMLRVLMLALCILVVRPGVTESIMDLSQATFQEDSIKGKSYSYRWRLWGVAWDKIRKSPTDLVFGYGGNSTETMDLSSYFGPQQGGGTFELGFSSWDNEWARDLVQFGLLGFALRVALYAGILMRALGNWRKSPRETKDLWAALVTGIAVYLFGMTNVSMFSPQLDFMFWTLGALVVVWSRLPAEPGEEEAQRDSAWRRAPWEAEVTISAMR